MSSPRVRDIPKLIMNQLADKAIKDRITRIIVIFGGCAGLCYNALWYFPVLIVVGGTATLIWDIWLQRKIGKLRAKWQTRRVPDRRDEDAIESSSGVEIIDVSLTQEDSNSGVQRRTPASSMRGRPNTDRDHSERTKAQTEEQEREGDERIQVSEPVADTNTYGIPIKVGICILAFFIGIIPHVMY